MLHISHKKVSLCSGVCCAPGIVRNGHQIVSKHRENRFPPPHTSVLGSFFCVHFIECRTWHVPDVKNCSSIAEI